MKLASNHTQKRIALAIILVIGLLPRLFGALSAPYQPTPSFDKRRDGLVPAPLSAERQQSVAALAGRIPGVRVDWDPISTSPVWIGTPGLLSGPTKAEIERVGNLGLAIDDPHRAVKAFIIENAALFGHGLDVLSNTTVVREYVTPHNQLRTVQWEQRLDGIPVFEATFKGHITKWGELVNVSSRLLTDIEAAAGMGQEQRQELEAALPITAAQAVAIALADVGQTIEGLKAAGEPLPEPAKKQAFSSPALFQGGSAGLMWLPLNSTALRLCWSVTFNTHSAMESFWTLVDAVSGEVRVRHNVTAASGPTPATYRIYPSDSPMPGTPGLSTPSSWQAPEVSSQLVTLPYLSRAASPLGWIPSGANSTEGPNVRACLNRRNK